VWLTLWRDNDARLQPTLAHSEITAELAPVSTSLRQVAEIGLRSLDAIEHQQSISVDSQGQELAVLTAAAKPQAILLLMVAQPVEVLVKAAQVQTARVQ
jgi:hypothetical protein